MRGGEQEQVPDQNSSIWSRGSGQDASGRRGPPRPWCQDLGAMSWCEVMVPGYGRGRGDTKQRLAFAPWWASLMVSKSRLALTGLALTDLVLTPKWP